MQEYIIAYNNTWIHFFIKPHVGLCYRKKNNLKFEDYKIIEPGASADFCVYSDGNTIHVICQDEKGSVLYLFFDGDSWKRTVLLKSRTALSYKKHFVIVEISGYISVLYTIENKEKLMLIHQLLIGNAEPTVIDYIKYDSVPFCVYKHHETDFSLFYTNEEGSVCEIIYKWSQKQFQKPYIYTHLQNIKFAQEKDGIIFLAAVERDDKTANLVYLTKKLSGEESHSLVYPNCNKDIIPIISTYGEKQYMAWTEYGNVISSWREPDGSWSKPIQYAKSSKNETKLYAICREGKYEHYYGIAREHDFILYGTHDVLKTPPKSQSKYTNISSSDLNDNENLIISHGKQIKQLCNELSIQRKKLSELSAKLESLLSDMPIADEDVIDNVLLKSE